jgi:ankyrin repeat protein
LHVHAEGDWDNSPYGFRVDNAQALGPYGFVSEDQNPTSAPLFHRNNDIAFGDPSIQTRLHDAILYGTEEEVNALLSSGVSVSTWNLKGNQPLHEAIIKGDVPVIKLLLKYGADVNSAGADRKTPLHLAASSPEVLDLLLKKRPAVSLQDRAGNTTLHLLLQKDEWWTDGAIKSKINDLLSHDADINITNEVGESPFHLLLEQIVPNSDERLHMLLNFLDHNPNISLPMPSTSLPFETLLKKLKPILKQLGEQTYTYHPRYLRGWVDKRQSERRCLKQFLSLGADADTVVTKGSSLLQYCLEGTTLVGNSRSGELVMLIIQLANVNLAGPHGNYPLHQILSIPSSSFSGPPFGKSDYIKALIGRNANVNQPNASGARPLEFLLSKKDGSASSMIDHAMLLLEAGAIPMLITSEGKRIFDLIDENVDQSGQHKLAKILLETDVALKTDIPSNYPSWAKSWRAACNESQWIVAKHFLDFEEPTSNPLSKTFLDCAFITIAESLLRDHKAQLVLWQAARLEQEAARPHRQEYVAILKDCNERQAAIEPSWYKYLVEIMDFD